MNVKPDFGVGAHGEAAAKLTRDRDAAREFAKPRFSDGGGEKKNVVSECDPAQPRISPRQREGNERQGDEKVEKFSKYKSTHFRGRIWIPSVISICVNLWLDFYLGTSADLRISMITESDVTPSSSASARSVRR